MRPRERSPVAARPLDRGAGDCVGVVTRLELTYVASDRVDFEAHFADGLRRRVSVRVGHRRAVVFPNQDSEAGETLGTDILDQEVRLRAAEELVRLAAAQGVVRRTP